MNYYRKGGILPEGKFAENDVKKDKSTTRARRSEAAGAPTVFDEAHVVDASLDTLLHGSQDCFKLVSGA